MRNSIIFLTMIVFMISFISIACTSDDAAGDKKDIKDVDKIESPDGQQNENLAAEGEETTPQSLEENGELVNPDGTHDIPADQVTQNGMSTTAAGDVTATTAEDGSTVIVDSSGNVIEKSESADGATQATPGTTSSGTSSSMGTSEDTGMASANNLMDATATPAPGSTDKPTLTRGGVNIQDKIAVMKTNFGFMYIFFYTKAAPNHVRNFMYLAEKDFFKNIKFHRIKPGFMAQAGIARDDWTEEIPPLKLEIDPTMEAKHITGALSAARTSDRNSATSQFFIVFNQTGARGLDSDYSVYGQVFTGFDVLTKIEGIKVGPNPQMGGEISKPLQDVIILDVVIEDAAKYQKDIDKWKAQNS